MRTTSYTNLRQNLAAMIDQVNDERTPVLITRDGKTCAVLMSAEDFASWEETLYLMKSPRNAEELMSSIDEYERGNFQERKLIE